MKANSDSEAFSPTEAMQRLRELMAEARKPTLRNWRVLIVEDNDDDRFFLHHMLQGYPCNIYEASNAPASIDRLLDGEEFDLCFLDLKLNHGSRGVDVINAVRSKRPNTRFVLVSGYTNPEQMAELVNLGVFTTLPKPVLKQDLDFIFSATPG